MAKRYNRRIVSELSLTKSSVKPKKILWEQPNKDKDVHYGMVGEEMFFKIERKGYKLYLSATPQAFVGIYDDWSHSLTELKKKALVALEKRGIVNHILN